MSVTQRKRQPVLGWACMVALGIAMVNGCSEPPEPPKAVRPVKSMVLESAAPAVRRNYPGSVQASQRAVLAFRVSGPLIELPIQDRIITQGELDQAVAANDVAAATVEASRKNLDKAKAGARQEEIQAQEAKIQGLESQVETTKHALDDTALTAPFDGVVAQRLVENFEKVEAKQAILLFQDLENIEIVINLPENVVAKAKEGASASMAAVFDALPDEEFALTFKEFSTEADSGTQTYKTTLTMPRPETINVFSGMTCTVIHYEDVAPGEQGSVFAIPVTAVRDENGKQFVWVIDTVTKTVGKREIQVGDLTRDSIRVLDGLKQGETIAISGVHFLQEGMEVSTLGPEIGDQLK